MADEQDPQWAIVIDDVRAMRRLVNDLEDDVIVMLRSMGATWEYIGAGLGISRRAAARRYELRRSHRS